MRKFLFLLVFIVGCREEATKVTNDYLTLKGHTKNSDYLIREFEYKGCEYVAFGIGKELAITHKGNCKYCQQR